MNIEMTTSA
ncbi:hypothetical protein CARUB_v100243010mg, partial [Capsella rubella]